MALNGASYSKILYYLSNHKPDICSLFCDKEYSPKVSELMYTCMKSIREYQQVHKKQSAYIDDQVAQYILKTIWEQIPFDDNPTKYYLDSFHHHLSQNIPIVVMDFIKLIVKSDKSKYDQGLKEFCYLHCMSVEDFKQFINACKLKNHDILQQYSDKLSLSSAYLLSLPFVHQEYVEKVTIRGFLKYHQNLPITYEFLQSVWNTLPTNQNPLHYINTLNVKLQQSQEVPSMIMKFINTITSNVNELSVYNQALYEFSYLHCMSNDEFNRFFQACDELRKHNEDEKRLKIVLEYSVTLKYTQLYYLSTKRKVDELQDIQVLIVREFRNYHHFVEKIFQHIRSDYPDVHRQLFFKDGLIKLRAIEPFFYLMFDRGLTNEEIMRCYSEIQSLQFKGKQVIDGVKTETTISPINGTKELRTTFVRSAFLVGIIEVMFKIEKLDEASKLLKYEDVKDLNYRQLTRVRDYYKIIHKYLESLILFTDSLISIQQVDDIPKDQIHCYDAKNLFNEALTLTTSFLNMYCESGSWKVLAFWRHKTIIKKILMKMRDGYNILRKDIGALIEKYKVDVINEVDDLNVGDIFIIPFRNYSHMAYACIKKYNANEYKVFIFNGGLHYELFTGEDSEIRTKINGKRFAKACIRTTKDPKIILTKILDAQFTSKETIVNIFQSVSEEIMDLQPFYDPNIEHDEFIELQEYGNCPLFNLFITICKVKPDCYDLLKKAIIVGVMPYFEAHDLLNLHKFKEVTDSWIVFQVFSVVKTMQRIGHHC